MRQGLRFAEWFRRWPPALRSRIAQAVVLVALLIVLAFLYRAPLADRLWPETRAQALREAAAVALARGHLTAADGSGARELYEAALALDPDRVEARAGLQRVAQAALAEARMAIRAQRFEEAHRALRLARALSVREADARAVANLLREREAALAGLDALLARAERARADGRIDAALPLYRRVLSLQPHRTAALEGREDALSDLLQQADAHIAGGRLADAAALAARAAEFDAGHVGLPDTRAALARALDAHRDAATRALRRGALQEAARSFRELLAIDSRDGIAHAGLRQVAQAHARRSERFAADFRFDEAARELARARAIAPEAADTMRASRRLVQARRSQRQLPRPATDPARVRALLVQVERAQARGDLMQPPGESAYDYLRTARALAPRDPAVAAATARLLAAARECFERELTGNRLTRAHACLDARIQLDGSRPGAGNLRDDRRRLATRWVAVGVERLGAGELPVARRAATAARALDAGASGLAALEQRLRAAEAASAR